MSPECVEISAIPVVINSPPPPVGRLGKGKEAYTPLRGINTTLLWQYVNHMFNLYFHANTSKLENDNKVHYSKNRMGIGEEAGRPKRPKNTIQLCTLTVYVYINTDYWHHFKTWLWQLHYSVSTEKPLVDLYLTIAWRILLISCVGRFCSRKLTSVTSRVCITFSVLSMPCIADFHIFSLVVEWRQGLSWDFEIVRLFKKSVCPETFMQFWKSCQTHALWMA